VHGAVLIVLMLNKVSVLEDFIELFVCILHGCFSLLLIM